MFEAGLRHQERACLGGNRVGKTEGIGGYETALHATGLYPSWWEGWRLDKKNSLIWACGTKSIKVRDVNQKKLLGTITKHKGYTHAEGGLIPSRCIIKLTRKSGVSEAIDQAFIRHRQGYQTVITFKSYEEGRTSFEAEAVDFIWLDEEPPKTIYDECLLRLLTTMGRILCTFTPLEGMTECVLSLLKGTDLI